MDDDTQTEFTAEDNAALAPETTVPETKPAVVETEKPVVEEKPVEGDQPAAKPEGMVPSSRLREEAEKRREAEQRYQRDIGKLEERLNRLQQVVAKPEEQPKAADWDNAPLDAGKKLTQDLAEVRQILQQREQNENFRNTYAAQAQQFAAQQPDFMQAYNHFVASISGELQDAGWTDPTVIQQEVMRMEMSIASKAMQDGVNPAERIYAVAKRRGFAAPAANGNGQKTEQNVVETLRKGQNAATSTANAGGAPNTGMSLAKLLEMDDTDFAKVSDRDWKKIMGG